MHNMTLDALVLFQLNNYLVMADNYRQVMASYKSRFAQAPRYNRYFSIFSNIYSCKGL